MHYRIPRILGALTVATVLTGGLAVSTAVATPAPLGIDGQNLSPAFVSWSDPPTTINLGGFHMTATNTSTSSNISHVYLDELSGSWVYGYSVTAPSDYSCSPIYDASTNTGSSLQCTFGQLNPGQSIDITVALISPSSGSTWPVDFEWSTNGFVSSSNGNNQSRGGDISGFSFPTTVNLTSGSGDTAGTFVWDSSQQTVENNQTLNKNTNTQSAQLSLTNSQDVGIPLSVADGPGVSPATVSGVSCEDETIVTQWTSLNANKDHTLHGPLHATIVVYHGPNAKTVNGLCWVHFVYNSDGITGSWVATELLNLSWDQPNGGLCPSVPPTLDPDVHPACFTLTNVGPNLQIDFYSLNNGQTGLW